MQRGDEQDEQKLRIDAPLELGGHRQREHRAEGDLHERQRQRRQELVQNAGGDDRREQEQNQLEGLHLHQPRKALLGQSLVGSYGDGIGKVEGTGALAHGDAPATVGAASMIA